MKFGKKKDKENNIDSSNGNNIEEKNNEKIEKKKEKKEKSNDKKSKKSKDEATENVNVRKVFGGTLPFLFEEDLPTVVVQCIDYLEANGLQTPGIFRENGSLSSIQNYRQLYDSHKPVQFPSHEAHVVASLLKAYLRELKEPICSYEHYDMFIACESISDEKVKIELLKKVISLLPPYNKKLLKYICHFLLKVVENCEVNKMTPDALSVVFLPTILRPKANSDLEVLQFTVEDSKLSKTLMSSILLNYDEIFEDPNLFQPRRQRAQTEFVSPSTSHNSTASSILSSKAALSPSRSPAQISPNFSPQHTPILLSSNSSGISSTGGSLPNSLPILAPISNIHPSSTISALSIDTPINKSLPPPPPSTDKPSLNLPPPSISSILPPPPPLPNKKDCKINLNNYNLVIPTPSTTTTATSNTHVLPPIENTKNISITIPSSPIKTSQELPPPPPPIANLTPTKDNSTNNLQSNISPRPINLPTLPPKPPSLTLPTLPPKPIPKIPNANILENEGRQRSNTTFV